tara:strand:+ start:44134 stop:45171 length:1038 start_codon:yes stop_codon:yes gene_type:complete
MIDSYTHSCVACYRRCPREFDLRYIKQLERAGDDREVLRVGQAWHKAHDASSKKAQELHPPNPHSVRGDPACGLAGYAAIAKHAPGPKWNEKLRRLFSAYAWRWANQDLKIIESERTFDITLDGTRRRGQIDGVIEIDGQLGNLERKTSSEDLDDGSPFWERQRMGVQVSIYANAFTELFGKPPAFTLYDVVRKPTIRVKSITKKDTARLRAELDKDGVATYFGEQMPADEVEAALAEGRETLRFYGARLTADVGDRPDFYFARKIIPRTTKDLTDASDDVAATIWTIEANTGMWFARNPDACATFGLCDFFQLCSNGEYPGDDTIPEGFAQRGSLHPELEEATE